MSRFTRDRRSKYIRPAGVVVDHLASAFGVTKSSADILDRQLATSGVRNRSPRGRAATHASSLDVAKVTIALMSDAAIRDVSGVVHKMSNLPLATDLTSEQRKTLGLDDTEASGAAPTSGEALGSVLSKMAAGEGPEGARFSFVTELPGAMMEFRDETGPHCVMFGEMDRLSEQIGFCRIRVLGTPLLREVSEVAPPYSFEPKSAPETKGPEFS